MEIPCKLTFKGPLKELQKVQKYFSSALKIQIHITNTSSNSPFISCETVSPATANATPKRSPRPGKRGVDTVSAECSQEKRVKCVTIDDSESVSSCNTTISLNSSEKSPLPKKDAPAVEKEKQVVHATVDVDSYELIVTINAKGVWVQLCRNTLTMEDKCIIEDGHQLTDKHINFASCLISRQFPQIGGLRTTLLQTRY